MKNPNAHVAAITSFFVWTIGSVVAHFHLVAITPNRILIAAGACTCTVLWIGKDGIRGALRRVWDGSNVVVNGRKPTTKS